MNRSEGPVGANVRTSVGVLDKVVTILRAFPAGNAALSPQEIAGHTRLSLPTVYRLLQALDEHGLVEQEAARYRLGLALLHLGTRVGGSLEMRRQATPHLEWLNKKTGENAELHIRREETRVPIELVCSSHNLRPFVEIGEPLPLHLGASGKVLLAWLSKDDQERLATASAARFGSGTLPAENASAIDADTLHAQLLEVRTVSWVASDGERSPGVAAVAAPVFDAGGNVSGALLVSAPSVRLPAERVPGIASVVLEAASRTSAGLGYDGSRSYTTIPSELERGM